MGRFDGWLILTDLDGTLLKNDKSISEENRQAIRDFQAEGGLFSFVTGRIPQGARAVAAAIAPNAPCGHSNGGCIYDHRIGKALWGRTLPETVTELADHVLEHVPTIGVIVCTYSGVYFHRDNGSAAKFRAHEGFDYIARDMREVNEPIAKLMFVHEDEAELMRVVDTLAAHPRAAEFSFIRSDQEYYEVLPKGSAKGELIPRLSALTGVAVERIIAVGDNDNDASMLRAAGTGVAVSNASAAAKAAADYVMATSNEQHAIARIIEELGKRVV